LPDRRQHHRLEVSLPSKIIPRENEAALLGTAGNCYIHDLSPTGLLLFMPRPVPEGTTVDVEFALPGDTEKVRVTGRVVWTDAVHKHGGIQVVGIDNADLERVGGWVEELVKSGEMQRSMEEFRAGLLGNTVE